MRSAATKSLQRREEELRRMYGRYATEWPEDWPDYVKITFTRDLFRERIRNKHQIFFLFYPTIGVIVAIIISIIVGVVTKSIAWLPVLLILIALIVVVYNAYFYFLQKQVDHMNQIIGEYYNKYGRNVLKNLYKKYRANELPPEPERYPEMDSCFCDCEPEKTDAKVKEGESNDGSEEQAKNGEEAEYAFDLRLVGGDDQNDSGDNAQFAADDSSDADDAGESTETNPEGSDSGEPEPAIPEETEEESRRNYEFEAVAVIDADLPEPEQATDDRDNPERETIQTIPEADVLTPDDTIEDEDDINLIINEINDWPNGEELSADSETFVDDLYDELEDYKEDEESEPEEEPFPEVEPEPVEKPIETGGEEVQLKPIPELKTFDEFFAYFQLDNG